MGDPVVRPWRRRWRHRRRRRRPIAQRRSAACRLPLGARSAVERASEREGGVNVTPRRPEHGFARREQNEPEIFALSRSLALSGEEGRRGRGEKFLFRCCFSLFSFSLPINGWRDERRKAEPSGQRTFLGKIPMDGIEVTNQFSRT